MSALKGDSPKITRLPFLQLPPVAPDLPRLISLDEKIIDFEKREKRVKIVEAAFGGRNRMGYDRIGYPRRDWICILGYVYSKILYLILYKKK